MPQDEYSRYGLTQQYDLQFRQHLHDVGLAAAKMIASFSAGAIILSVSFLGYMIEKGAIEFPGFLYISWVLFILSIVISLLNFVPQQHWLTANSDLLWANYNDDKNAQQKIKSKLKRTEVWSRVIVYWAIFCFIFGLTSMAVFGYKNTSKSAQYYGNAAVESVRTIEE